MIVSTDFITKLTIRSQKVFKNIEFYSFSHQSFIGYTHIEYLTVYISLFAEYL